MHGLSVAARGLFLVAGTFLVAERGLWGIQLQESWYMGSGALRCVEYRFPDQGFELMFSVLRLPW